MKTFELHIIRRLVTGYLAMVGGLVVFFVVLHYVEYIDDFMDRGATMSQVFSSYYPNYIPEIIRLVSPLAIFLSTVFLTGRLAQNLEISALQTSGVSLYRLMLPYLLVGITLSVFMFWFNGWVVPQTNRDRITFEQQYTKDGSGQIEYANIHRQNRPGSILSVGFFDRSTKTAQTVSLHTFDGEKRLIERIDAPRMVWIDSTSQWRFFNPVIRVFSEEYGERLRKIAFLDTTLTLLPRDLSRTEIDVEAMTIDEGRDYIDELRRSGANRLGRPLVAYHSKFSYPIANLILILLGMPMASVRRRGGQAVQLGLGLFIAFTYLALMKLTEPFGYSESLPPVLVAWLPHVVFALLAVTILVRVRK
ncbi:MAG: LptF/LptG family permease [Bacteroidetes bacterium]|nr:LptF/LptG family permease [Bacteroidota bacterium]